jgi:hypothetical protein
MNPFDPGSIDAGVDGVAGIAGISCRRHLGKVEFGLPDRLWTENKTHPRCNLRAAIW